MTLANRNELWARLQPSSSSHPLTRLSPEPNCKRNFIETEELSIRGSTPLPPASSPSGSEQGRFYRLRERTKKTLTRRTGPIKDISPPTSKPLQTPQASTPRPLSRPPASLPPKTQDLAPGSVERYLRALSDQQLVSLRLLNFADDMVAAVAREYKRRWPESRMW